MIRTVIQQKNSFTITLPKKWASKHDLKDKDPLRIEENEFSNKLLISPLNTVMEEKPETIIDVEHLDYNDVLI
ncbi:MAG: AbrB/MazE/SpoVT family DNA-binding domain-containing protein, partial [Candidatus Woesearchaeota archaeon]